MTNERGWKDGVYNPGFAPMKAYLERKAKEFAEAGIEFPEIKSVRFRQGVIRRKPRLFFDPFNMTGLPDHILTQVKDDFYFWYNDYAMRQEFQVLELRLEEARKTTPIDPHLQDLFDRGLISQGQLDLVTLLRGKPTDMYSDIFAKPIGNIPVVPPDEDVPMFGGVPMVQSGIDYTKHRLFAPGSLERIRHGEEQFLDHVFKEAGPIVLSPEAQAEYDKFLEGMEVVFENGKLVKDLSLDDIRRMNLGPETHVELGDPQAKPFVSRSCFAPKSGQVVDKGVEVRVIPDDYEFPPHVSKPGDGYKLDHVAPLPSARGIRPLILGQMDTIQSMSQGRGRDETMAVYQEYQGGLGKLMDGLVESRSAEKSLLPKPDLTAGEVGDASVELAKIRSNPLREHWVKHGDPYEGRLPLGDPKLDAIVQDLLQEHSDPELAAKVKRRIMDGLGDLESNCDEGTPPWNPTPEEIADAEEVMQEAAEGKLDYLLEGTQWDPKLRK